MRLLIFIFSSLLSYVAWWLAEPSLGFMWAFFLSGVGAMLGVYVGWKIGRSLGL